MKDKKITSIDYILRAISVQPYMHIQNLVEGYAEACQTNKIRKTNRGYASAINRAVEKLQKEGKIRIIEHWFVELVK